MELYDINKDEWSDIGLARSEFDGNDTLSSECKELWIDNDNPNILMRACIESYEANSWEVFNARHCNMYIDQIDVRMEKNHMNSKLIWSDIKTEIVGAMALSYSFFLRLAMGF